MKKTICLMLILAMSLSVMLFGCAPDSGETSSADASSSEVSREEQDIKGFNNETGKYEYEIPEGTMYSGDFKFLTCGVNQDHESEIIYNVYEGNASEGMATYVNEAILERNNLVEEKLGVTITEEYVYDAKRYNGVFYNRVRTDRISNSADYQVVVPCLYDGANLAVIGELLDLNEIVDTEYPWWSQPMNEDCTVNGRLYFTLSDIGYITMSNVPALAFNQKWVEEYHLEDPYQLVRDHEWTIDKVLEMVKTYKEDTDGDNKTTYRDIFGWSGQLDDMWSMFYGTGEKIAKIGSDGYPVLSIFNDRSVGVMSKLQELVQNKDYYVSANDYFGEAQWPTVLTQGAFIEGRCLFYNGSLGSTSEYARMSDDFGLLPMPLYDENQESYYSLANPWTCTCFGVPTSVLQNGTDLNMVRDVLEYMGATSKNLLENAFVNIVLEDQKTRDEATPEMIKEYILPGRGCDFGMIFNLVQINDNDILHYMASAPKDSFASTYDSAKDSAQSKLDQTIDYFKELE